MATVKKRIWTTKQGESREAWICDYTDQGGVRRQKTFAKKKPKSKARYSQSKPERLLQNHPPKIKLELTSA